MKEESYHVIVFTLQDDILEPPDDANIENHDEMQDSSSQEKGSPSPTETSHDTLITTTRNSSNMQLPLTVLAPSLAIDPVIENGNSSGQNLDLPGTAASGVSQLAAASLCPDSQSLSQPQQGQHFNTTSADKTQNTLLQEQIKLFKEKQLQLAKLQAQIESLVRCQMFNNAPSNVNFNSISVDTVETLINPRVTNTEYMKQTVSKEIAGTSQGVIHSDVDLDVNSNMTVKSSDSGDSFELPEHLDTDTPPVVHGGHTSDFTTPQKQTDSPSESEDALTPFILRKPTVRPQSQDTAAVDMVSSQSSDSTKCSGCERESEAEPNVVVPPIMTPMAMKTVARQQEGKEITSQDLCKQDKPLNLYENLSESDCDNMSDRQVLSEDVTESVLVSRGLKTPPVTKKQSAFQKLGQSGLTPVIGSLSLRANSNQKLDSQGDSGSIGLLKGQILHKANERYFEALLDNEVELYACRLVMEHTCSPNIRCYNPVAKTLMDGDDMVGYTPSYIDSNPKCIHRQFM